MASESNVYALSLDASYLLGVLESLKRLDGKDGYYAKLIPRQKATVEFLQVCVNKLSPEKREAQAAAYQAREAPSEPFDVVVEALADYVDDEAARSMRAMLEMEKRNG